MMIYEICALLTIVSACTGFVMMTRMAMRETEPKQLGAIYALSRSLALLIVAFIPLIVHSVQLTMLTAALLIVVQVADAYVSANGGHRRQMLIQSAVAVLHLIALILLAC